MHELAQIDDHEIIAGMRGVRGGAGQNQRKNRQMREVLDQPPFLRHAVSGDPAR